MSDDLATYRGVNSSLSTDLHVLLRRRMLFGSLVAATSIVFALWFYYVVAAGGFGLLESFLMFFFLAHTTWLTLAFWNTLIGFYLLRASPNALARELGIPRAYRDRDDYL